MLAALCQTLPFLRQMPVELLTGLDTSTLYVPSGTIAQIRCKLEQQLNYHIVTYRAAPPVLNGQERLHLCQLLLPASLTSAEIEQIRQAEIACQDEGVVLVAYEKPLRLRKQST
jgi:hypothetical protein